MDRLKIGTVWMVIRIFLIALILLPACQAFAGIDYSVVKGDTLYLIGKRFGVSASEIMVANNLKSTMIYVGQRLYIPLNDDGQGNYVTYRVVSGDTIYLIGKKFKVSGTDIMRVNGLDSTMIYPGQILYIPVNVFSYTVKKGDTLYLLSERFNTTVDAIAAINNLKSTLILVGQQLKIPGQDLLPGDGSDSNGDFEGWINVPSNVSLHYTAPNENLWLLSQKYNTSIDAIIKTNNLKTNMLLPGQPLFIPVGSKQAVNGITVAGLPVKQGFGEMLDWKYASWLFPPGSKGVLVDLDTGLKLNVYRLGGAGHADCEPLTVGDTQLLNRIFGYSWSWEARAALLQVNGRVIACSMSGMPHDIQSIADNNFPGHFDLHFLNSRTHKTNSISVQHQEMVKKAAGK